MKILFLITQSEIGGAQRYLLELAPFLLSRGHEVILAAGEGDGELFAEFKSGIYYIKNLVRDLNPIKDILAIVSILKIIKKEKPDVLFLQSTKAGFLGSLAAKLYKTQYTKYPPTGDLPPASPERQQGEQGDNIQVIYRIGGWTFRDPRPWWMNKILFCMERISARWKDVIIVNSEYDRQLAIAKKIAPAEKVVKIYNGIDANNLNILDRNIARNALSRPPSLNIRGGAGGVSYSSSERQRVIVGTIANLYATKGIEYLIEAAHVLFSTPYTLPTILFIVIGEGKERHRLEALIEKYNLEGKFFLVGRIPSASQYLKAFDMFVLPSVKEGFPWVLLEAMAAEVPIVATKVGAVPEIIEDGKNGLLVPPKNSKALAEKVSLLMSQPYIHDREQMVVRAKKKLQRFSSRKMLEESERLIKDL